MFTQRAPLACLRFLLLSTLTIFIFSNSFSQNRGCTDPQANNYDTNAIQNDGSCLYPNTSYAPFRLIDSLPDSLSETSGLVFFNNSLWAINDSGNENLLFQFNATTGKILRSVRIYNAANIDWEELAEDLENIYVGDFGNNAGNRKDLKIYSVKKTDIIGNLNDSVTATIIPFSFSNQVDFSSANNNTNFDCEAFFVWKNCFHIFSKSWKDGFTRYYKLKNDGSNIALLQDSFDVQGLITGAGFDSISGKIALSGYTKSGNCLLWLLWDYPADSIFEGNKRKIEIGSFINTGQIEGVCFKDSNNIFLTNERFIVKPHLMTIPIGQWTNNFPNGFLDNKLFFSDFEIFPNPTQSLLNVRFQLAKPSDVKYQLMNSNCKQVISSKLKCTEGKNLLAIPVDNLPEGMYQLIIQSAGSRWCEKVMINHR